MPTNFGEKNDQGAFFPIVALVVLVCTSSYTTYNYFSYKPVAPPEIPCDCNDCLQKRQNLSYKKSRLRRTFTRSFALMILSISLMLLVAYYCSKIVNTASIWNPYEELGISTGLSEDEIKRVYKKLARQLHPDKAKKAFNMTAEEVEKKFVQVTKAYKALTDETIRQNWEEFGHPDGRQDTSVGIALPSWIFDQANNAYVLGTYVVLIMGLCPFLIGRWWYKSSLKTKDGIANSSAERIFHNIHADMTIEEILVIIASAKEFDNIPSSVMDDPALTDILANDESLDFLFNLTAKIASKDTAIARKTDTTSTERALTLLYAHFNRIQMSPANMKEKDKVVKVAPRLIQAFVIIAQAFQNETPLRRALHLHACVVQAIPPHGSPLLQLPHITNDIVSKLAVQQIYTLQSLVSLGDAQRRKILTDLNDKEYDQLMTVARNLPFVEILNAYFKVLGDKIIVVGSIINVVLKVRTNVPGSKAIEVSHADLFDKEHDEGDIDLLIGRKSIDKEPEKTVLTHAPFFPEDNTTRWYLTFMDSRSAKIGLPPTAHADIGSEIRTIRIQSPGPPQPQKIPFTAHLRCNSYIGLDVQKDMMLEVHPVEDLPLDYEEDDISDPEEDSLAGAMSQLKGGKVVPAGTKAKLKKRKKIAEIERKQIEDEIHSSDDELSDTNSADMTDASTDSEAE